MYTFMYQLLNHLYSSYKKMWSVDCFAFYSYIDLTLEYQ
jgi:hypothetical protein